MREASREIPDRVKHLYEESSKYFHNQLAEFVYYRTYSRWIDAEGRRETWMETVDRYVDFMRENLGKKLSEKEYAEVRQYILEQKAMPSMRLLQFAGKAARTTNVCAYNCSFVAPEKLQDFGEIMYVLMCGTGLGFSAESKNVQKLPQIKEQTGKNCQRISLKIRAKGGQTRSSLGSLRGMKATMRSLISARFVLPARGSRHSADALPGPDSLRSVLHFARTIILKKQGRRLSNIDVHDLVCKIGEVVLAGGVRRSALISLSDLDDEQMRDAKKGQFYLTEPQRSMANNSAVYEGKPTNVEFLDEWVALMKSGSGERGIFNRGSLAKTMPERRIKALGGYLGNIGVNPCGEILLQSKQFCNLSEVVARADDTLGL